MIVDKKNKQTANKAGGTPVIKPQPVIDDPPAKVEDNPIVNVYRAVRRILSRIPSNPNDPNSPPLFRTVKMDNGQFDRIIRSRGNEEYAVAFPAAFIRFTNVRFLVQQQRVGEGRANMRIRYILNNLNSSDDDVEIEGAVRFQQINDAIQDAKDTEPALNERCNLTFWDMPEIMADGLQPYWIDYEIWFRTTSSFQYRKWVDRYLVMPPFTNHSDAPEHDTEGHGDHREPTYDESSRFTPSAETYFPFSTPGEIVK